MHGRIGVADQRLAKPRVFPDPDSRVDARGHPNTDCHRDG
jgi:hypothetical protein